MPDLRSLARWSAALLSLASLTPHAAAQRRIENTATLRYSQNGSERTVASNTVALDVRRAKLPTAISFRLLPPGTATAAPVCEPGPPIVYNSAPVDAATLASAPPLRSLDLTTPMILVLEDATANIDPEKRDASSVTFSADALSGVMTLTETGPNTGVFAGVAMASSPAQHAVGCDLAGLRGQRISFSHADDEDSFDSSNGLLIDPAGYTFDSRTGVLIDGARVTITTADGGTASVFGDDGVSPYPSAVVSGQPVQDASGRIYPAEPGRFRFPLLPPGRYRITVEPPAPYRAPSVVTPEALASLRDPIGRSFIINDASYGRPFDLFQPDPFLLDIPLDRDADAALLLTKTASIREASPGDFVQYRIALTNRGDTSAAGVTIADTLPAGLRYERGSTRGAAEPDVAADGRTLRFALPPVAAGAAAELRYVVSIAPGAPVGEALNRARAEGPGVSSNEAAASVRLRPLLFTDAITVIGRVTEGRCGDPASGRKGVAGVRLLLEDGTSVVTDRDGLYHFEGVRPGRHVVQIDRGSVPASHAPVACDQDTRQAGNATSRFVEGTGGLLRRVDFQLAPTGRSAADADALPTEGEDDATAAGNRDWLAGQAPGIDWLFPQVDHNPRAPAVRVAIKHRPGQRVALTLDGRASDPIAFDGTDVDAARDVAVSRWSGLPLGTGRNRLAARVLDADGSVAATLTRDVVVAGAAVRATLVPERSRLVADGLRRPLLAVRVTDASGRPVRAGTLVPFSVDQPYRAWQQVALEQGRQLAGRERAQVTARVVGDAGLAFVALQPTTRAGAVHVTVTLAEEKQVRTSEVRAWLSAAPKDWVVVGFGAGSVGYSTLDGHARTLPRGARGKLVTDGQLALYAKGRIKGSWLLTLAYDSDRAYDPSRGLLGTIDPDRYYTVYGDGAEQAYDAPTRRKLYLRLERRAFYALFGDFETGLTDTQLTRYNRTLNGVKAAWEGSRLRATGFAADTDSLYGRDEIQGNGLSGPYRLSGRNIVPNSDKLRIEVRDRLRSERILSSRQLTRHIDYDIDTLAGTLRFREPVLSRDAGLNPQFIVADYEVEGGRTGKRVAAGRVAAKIAGGAAEIGAAAIHDQGVGNATVLGIDGRARLGTATELRGEVATGGSGGLGAGLAYLAEVEHHGPALDLLGYVRQQDARFGVGQQNMVEAGTRKLGLDGRLRLADRLSVLGAAWMQDQLVGAGRRIAGDFRVEYRRDSGTVFLGGQFADDTGRDGQDRGSRLLTLGGTQALLGGKLELSGQTQLALGGSADSVDFPVRHQVGAAYRIRPGIRAIGGYEIADGSGFVARTARLGFDVAPWAGGKLLGTLNSQAIGENGSRTFAQYGLSQSLPIGKRWTVDGTFDATSTLSGRIAEGARISAFQPVATGGVVGEGANAGFVAATLGATYRADRWSWTGRVEYRDGDENDRLGLTTSFLRTLGEGRTLASSARAFAVTTRDGRTAHFATADLALALRPLDSRWSLLERLELRHEGAAAGFDDRNPLGVPAYGAGAQATTRIINNLAINYRTGPEGAGHGFDATLYHGAKYVRGRFADDRYEGFIHVAGFELRRDLGSRFDIGVAGSVQHAWDRGAVAFSGGPSAGVSPADDVWLTAGYNLSGYRDRDFEADRYTRAGPYLTLRIKFDQSTLRGASRALFGNQE